MTSPRQISEFWWVGHRAGDCLGLHDLVPVRQVFCCDFGQEFRLLKRTVGAEIHSLESDTRIRRFWSSTDIGDVVDSSSEEIQRLAANGSRPVMILYRANRRLEQWAKQGRLQLAAAAVDVVDAADDNLVVYAQLRTAGISQPRGDIIDLSRQSFRDLALEYGTPLVVKRRYSSAGKGCRLVWSRESLDGIARDAAGEPVLVTEFVRGINFNIHVVVGTEGIIVSRPSVQVVGVKPCASQSTVYCGNDFAAVNRVPQATLLAVVEAARRCGGWLSGLGYRGICGFDIIADGNNAWIIDVNPRFQGSTCLLTQLEMIHGVYPTALRHIREFVPDAVRQAAFPATPDIDCLANGHTSGAAQLILHSLSDTPQRVSQSLAPGVYRLNESSRLDWVRAGLRLVDCEQEGEFLVTCAVPVPGTIVEPGAAYLKVVTREEVIDVASQNLLPRARRIAASVADSFQWESVGGRRSEFRSTYRMALEPSGVPI